MTPDLPRGWRLLFQAEVALCALTAAVWVLLPDDYLARFHHADTPSHRYLLLQGATVVLTAWGYLYGRVLAMRPVPWAVLNRLQEAMGIGDVLLLLAFPLARRLGPDLDLLVAQHALAAGFLAARIVYLTRVGWPAERAG